MSRLTSLVTLGLGTNQGDRPALLASARRLIAETIGPIQSASSIHETAAWGYTDQPDFLNQVVSCQTALIPTACLRAAQAVETRLGRQRLIHWGPRTIDVDLLYFADVLLDTPALRLPHPHIADRAFVLLPLAEIAPDLLDPRTGRTVTQMLSDLLASDGTRPTGAE